MKSNPSNSHRHIPIVKVNSRMFWVCFILPLQKLLSRFGFFFETEAKTTLWTKNDDNYPASLAPRNRWTRFDFKGTLMSMRIYQRIYTNLPISSALHKNNMPKISLHKTVSILRYTLPRYMKCFFTNIQKQYRC